jgi:hypothetical protein
VSIEDEAPDILWGAGEIAKFIRRSARQTFHLLEAGHLPARRVGNRWCASKKRLRDALLGETTERGRA